MSERNITGALPPPEHAWQIGKTAATILFVKEAEVVLISSSELTPPETKLLEATVIRMKAGDESLAETDTVDEWLERLRNHFP